LEREKKNMEKARDLKDRAEDQIRDAEDKIEDVKRDMLEFVEVPPKP